MLKQVLRNATNMCKKNAPELLMGAGILGVGAGVFMACKATTKLNDILNDHKYSIMVSAGMRPGATKEEIGALKNEFENMGVDCPEKFEYTEEQYKKDIKIIHLKTAVNVVRLYTPSAITLGLAVTSLIASNNISRNRNAALSVALATTNKLYSDYRERVVDKFGGDTDFEMRYGFKDDVVNETIVDEKGKEKSVDTKVKTVNLNENDYSKFFDAASREWSKDAESNLVFLRAQEQYANDLLNANGILFLNDVYDMLDIPKTKAGQIVGWNKSDENAYVSFGIYDSVNGTRFVNGYEPVILLDFNVHGNVWETM